MSLDLQALRDADGRKIKELDVPELGGTLRIRMMSGTDFFKLREHTSKHPDDLAGKARILFIACIIDDDGKPMFDGRTVNLLLDQSSEMVLRLSMDILEFCGLIGGDNDKDDTVKN